MHALPLRGTELAPCACITAMAVMDSLLKCCHNCSIDDMNIKLEEGPPLLATDEVLSGHTLPTGPQDHAMRTYTLAEAVGLEGDPIHSGQLMYVRNGETTRVVTLSLYKNGFRLTPAKGDPELEEISSAWTPFSVLVKCHLRSVSAWSVFRLTNYTSAASVQSYHFATDGDAADSKREYWIQVMREVISGVTKSLFPLHSITVRPVPDVSATCERIMAGYLLLSDCSSGAALVYCELGAFKGGKPGHVCDLHGRVLCDRGLKRRAAEHHPSHYLQGCSQHHLWYLRSPFLRSHG